MRLFVTYIQALSISVVISALHLVLVLVLKLSTLLSRQAVLKLLVYASKEMVELMAGKMKVVADLRW